jgi:hypothetical protein
MKPIIHLLILQQQIGECQPHVKSVAGIVITVSLGGIARNGRKRCS